MKFQIKDKVVPKDTVRAHTNYLVHQVVGFLDGHVLTKMWGDGFGGELHHYPFDDDTPVGGRNWRSAIQRYQESELLTPEEALIELRRIEAEKDKFEAEFEGVRELVGKNLNDAAKLVQEAANLVKKTGADKDFYNMVGECKELFLALKDGGWSHSTMQCRYGR